MKYRKQEIGGTNEADKKSVKTDSEKKDPPD
jgi:hypothetical protein